MMSCLVQPRLQHCDGYKRFYPVFAGLDFYPPGAINMNVSALFTEGGVAQSLSGKVKCCCRDVFTLTCTSVAATGKCGDKGYGWHSLVRYSNRDCIMPTGEVLRTFGRLSEEVLLSIGSG